MCAQELQRRVSEGNAPSAALVTLFEMRRFDFTNLNPGSTSNDLSVVLHPALCVVDYTQVRLAVRVHALSMSLSSSQPFTVFAYSAMPSEEDPQQDFVDTTTPFLRLDIVSSTTVPGLLTASGTNPEAYLRFVLYAAQATSPLTFTATLSATVLLRRT